MDDQRLDLDLEADELEASLPADLLSMTPLPPAGDDAAPDTEVALPDGFITRDDPPAATSADEAQRQDEWEPRLDGPLFSPADAGESSEPTSPPPEFGLPEGLFETVEAGPGEADPAAPPVRLEEEVAPVVAEEYGDVAVALEMPEPDPEPAATAEEVTNAPATPGEDDAAVAPEPPSEEERAPVDDVPLGAAVALAPTTAEERDVAITSEPLPTPTPIRRPRLRSPRLARGVPGQRNARAAVAGVAASALLGAILVVRPDSDGTRQVETALPRPTVGTIVRPFPTSPPPLVASGAAGQPEALPDTPAPGGGPGQPGGTGPGPVLGPAGPGGPGVGAAPGGGSATAPAGSTASASPRAGSPSGSGGSGPPPASQPPPSPAPTRAAEPQPEPQPEEPRRDRRSDTTVETSPPTTRAPATTTTEPQWSQPEPPPPPPPPTRPPPTSPPTTAAPTPTTAPPSSIPTTPTRPCIDGDPPRPVPC